MTGKILRKPQAVIGLLMMLAVILAMIYAPHLAPNDPEKVNICRNSPSRRSSIRSARTI